MESACKLTSAVSNLIGVLSISFPGAERSLLFPCVIGSLTILILIVLWANASRPRTTRVPPSGEFDYIIVGGGLAGSVLAARLSEDSSKRVLVIESGTSSPRSLFIRISGAILKLFRNPAFDYCFQTVAEAGCLGRRIFLCRGKLLGGSTCLNAQLAFRASPRDFDSWGAGWSSEDCAATFDKIELRNKEPMASCGMHVQLPNYQHELSKRFLDTCSSGGSCIHPDLKCRENFNDWSTGRITANLKDSVEGEGFGRFELSQRNGTRWTGASSYLAVAMSRTNVTVLTGHMVSQVSLSSVEGVLTASGVVLKDVTRETVAGKSQAHSDTNATTSPAGSANQIVETVQLAVGGEVLLAAGALGSPQLLQLSGIGDPSVLKSAGVPLHLGMPEVGQGLQDHPAVTVAYESSIRDGMSEIKPLMPWLNVISPLALFKWVFQGAGILSTTFCDHGAFVRSSEDLALPDVQLRFVPGIGPAADGVKSYELLGKGIQHSSYGFTLQVINCRPKSTGSVSVVSPDPSVAPEVRCNYLSRSEDMRALLKGISLARELAKSGALREVSMDEVYPGTAAQSDHDLEAYIRSTLHSANGLSGGCCIGRVVDEQLRVKGVEGLRVADASVMPSIPGAQLAMPTTMIAERAATLIAGRG